MLLPLLLSSDNGVQGWAATHAFEFEPSQGKAILSDVAELKGRKDDAKSAARRQPSFSVATVGVTPPLCSSARAAGT